MSKTGELTVARLVQGPHHNTLVHASLSFRCAIGPAGVSAHKREGDGATPLGILPLRRVLYRPDKVRAPRCEFAVSPIRPNDGWCDAPGDPNYNRPVTLPYPASTESLWRDDDLYDVVVVLGYNDDPPIDGLGSCIFMHVARPDYAPTQGCIALAPADLYRLIEAVPPLAAIDTSPSPASMD